jgi:hypothetical protein
VAVSAQKLHPRWVRAFLKAPREAGKIYSWRVYRMPGLKLTDDEVEAMTRYLATIGKRPDGPPALPDPTKFPAAQVTKMIMPGLTPEDVEKVRMFLWKVSMEANHPPGR